MSAVQQIIVGELRTGRRLVALPVMSCSWTVAMGSAGSIEAAIPLRAAEFMRMQKDATPGLLLSPDLLVSPDLLLSGGVTRWVPGTSPRGDVAAATEPTRMFAAVLVGDRVIEAGPIWSRQWDDAAGMLTIRASGLRSIFDHRIVLSAGVSWSTPGAVAQSATSYLGVSLGTIQKRLVQVALGHTGGDLPVVFQGDEAEPRERAYPGAELATVGQRLEELSQVQDGPEFAFEPRLTADRLGIEWVMRTGTVADPTLHQAGMDWVADASASRGSVAGLTVTEDASSVATRAFAKGAGTDTATLISRPATRDDLLLAGFPLLESARTYSTVTEQSTIDSHAAADLESNDRPWQTWDLTIAADGRLGQYRPGDWWQVRVGEHVYLPAGSHRARLASMKGALGRPTVDLGMVPMEVAG